MAESVAKYQQYEEYKDSGVEWSETIPTHWKTASLSKLFMIKAGGDLQLALFSEIKTLEHQYPIYTNANDSKAVYGYTSKSNFPSDTITVSGRGEVGFAVYRNHEFDAIIRLLVLIPFIKLDGRFFAYFINEVIDFNVQSSAIGQLSTLQISPYKVIIPPNEEQHLISDYLDYETAQIDTLIDKQQTLIQLLKEKRQAVISHAVTKGLKPDAPMKDSGVEWLGDVPEHWVVCRIKDLSSIISKGTTPSTMGGELIDEGIRFLKAENIGKSEYVKFTPEFYISQKVNDQLARSKLEENDVLVIIAGATTGMASILQKELLPCNTNQAVSFIRPKNPIHSKWIAKWLSIEFSQRIIWMGAVQAAQPNLSMEDLGNIPITLPIGNEVAEIIKVIDIKLETFDRLISKAEQAIQLMQERRTALISAAVTGKIDVRGWRASE